MIDKIGFKPMTLVANAPLAPNGVGGDQVAKSFGGFLNDAIQSLNDQQNQVDQMNQLFVKGELSDVHQLTIASEKASLSLQLAVQVRNKAIEAYQEIMRMQM